MKKLLIALLFSLSTTIYADDFLTVDVGLGLDIGTGEFGEDASAGLGLNASVRYHLMDMLQVGYEYNRNAILAVNESQTNVDIAVMGVKAHMAKAYFMPWNYFVKPYVALGAGLGKLEEPEIKTDTGEIIQAEKKKNTFVISPEVGVYIFGFKLAVSYFSAGDGTISSIDLSKPVLATDPFPVKSETKAINFLQFSMGYSFTF